MKTDAPSYHGYRFPPEIISHAVWLYHRFCVSFRNVEELLARRLKRRQGRLGDTWHLDEVCLLFIHPPAPWVGSQPCGAKYPGFCADSKGV